MSNCTETTPVGAIEAALCSLSDRIDRLDMQIGVAIGTFNPVLYPNDTPPLNTAEEINPVHTVPVARRLEEAVDKLSTLENSVRNLTARCAL